MTPKEEFGPEEPEEMDEEAVKKALQEAEDIKSEGSNYFRSGNWNEALQDYQRALALVPPKPSQLFSRDKGKGKAVEGSETESAPSELEQECSKTRAILNGNVGACYAKLGEHKKVVEACTAALSDDPNYIKVLQRRAISNEILGTWSSLTSAEQDYTNLLNILPGHSPLINEIQNVLRKLKPRKEAAQSAEMGEMMEKLKGVGNSLLGNFGLSTDNFKFEPNGQGGYSINFVR